MKGYIRFARINRCKDFQNFSENLTKGRVKLEAKMGSDLCREILTKEWRQDKHKNQKILTHFDLWKCSENRQSEKSLKNIWR